MKKLRANIDVLDASLLVCWEKNGEDEIGLLKKANVLQNKRWNEILGKMILEGEKGLTEEFVLRMFKAIHQESIGHQDKVLIISI
jgi:chorismate mutase